MEILFLFIGLIIGGVAGWFFLRSRSEADMGKLEARNTFLKENLENTATELDMERTRTRELDRELSKTKADYQHLSERLTEQKQEVEQLQEKFKTEFKNIANELLEDKSKKFTEQNRINLSEILNPLGEKIKDFEKKVEDTHKETLEKNAALKQQLISLKELNEQMSKDATNLTKAIKGDSKVQGGMGEIILERVLERSGLNKGREYFVQESFTNEQGRRRQPDVLIKLPEGKTIIIDSKMSLTDYERYFSAESELDQQEALKNHILSIRRHIKQLSEKDYHHLYDIGSLDFVLMFVPIEPAFGIAIHHDNELFSYAYEKNIVIVSTSTLLATLKTIASIWRQEYQNRNAVEIARQSGALYDKFAGLVDDLIEVGRKLDQGKKSYEGAMKKLSLGTGNLVSRVEKIRELGAKTSKTLPEGLVNRATEKDQLKLIED